MHAGHHVIAQGVVPTDARFFACNADDAEVYRGDGACLKGSGRWTATRN